MPSKSASSSGAASPIATTADRFGAASASGERSTPFARPPAISTASLDPFDRRHRRVHVRGLGVVDERHAVDGGDHLSSVRLRLEGREPGAHRVGIDPERQRRRGSRRGIGREPRSVGVDRAHRALGSDDPGDDDTVDDADLALVRTPGAGPHHRTRRRRRDRGRARIVAGADVDVVRSLVRVDRSLRCGVGLERTVPVQVIGRQVQQHAHLRMQRRPAAGAGTTNTPPRARRAPRAPRAGTRGRCCRTPRRPGPRREGTRRPCPSRSSCRSCR